MTAAKTAVAHAFPVDPALERCPFMPTYAPPQVLFVRGDGTELWDDAGKRYLDFLCGLAVTSLGHAHPEVAAAVSQQAATLLHVSNLFATRPAAGVAATIDRLLGGGGQVFFTNSGAEANECAIKLARRWGGGEHGRWQVISAYGSFHGRTLATLTATGQPTKHEPFQPLPPGFRHVAWGDADAVAAAIDDTVAAVLVEAVQGEGGVVPAPPGYLAELRRLCDDLGLLLILDEVQTGLCRTGRWFGFQHDLPDGVRPDVVTLAKALGNGVPIGACWARADVAAAFRPGDHGTTYGGQPLAAAAAAAVLSVMERDGLPGRAEAAGHRLRTLLEAIPAVAAVRGRGLLLAAELEPAGSGGRTEPAGSGGRTEPAGSGGTTGPAGSGGTTERGRDARAVQAQLLARGLVTNAVTPTAIRLAPPLTVSDAELEEAAALIAEVLG